MSSTNFLPTGSLLLVSGANGYIGSHIIDKALQNGYRVRGTVRDLEKSSWVQDFFDKRYGEGKLELVRVQDFTQEGCLDEAVKGVDAFAHVASDLSFKADPNAIITPAVHSTRYALQAATKEPNLKSFVLTSSSTAATMPKPGERFHIDSSLWNEESVKEAWGDKPTPWNVYGASKTQAEQEAWKFAKENKPRFNVNTVLPNANFGQILDPKNQDGSTAGWVVGVCTGSWNKLKSTPPQWFVHVGDTALLHLCVLTDPSINNQRLFGFAETYNWARVLEITKKLRPDLAPTLPQPENEDEDLSTADNAPAERLLKERFGKTWTSLEDALKENLEAVPRKQ